MVWDLCIRLGGARGPPGTDGEFGIVIGRGLGSCRGGLLDNALPITGAINATPLSFLRLVFRPNDARKLPGDLFNEVGEVSERPEDEDELAMIVDALFDPLRGAEASAGYGSEGGALGGLESLEGGADRSVAKYASGRLGKVTSEPVEDSEILRVWVRGECVDGTRALVFAGERFGGFAALYLVSTIQSPNPQSYIYSSLIFCAYPTDRSRAFFFTTTSAKCIPGGHADLTF